MPLQKTKRMHIYVRSIATASWKTRTPQLDIVHGGGWEKKWRTQNSLNNSKQKSNPKFIAQTEIEPKRSKKELELGHMENPTVYSNFSGLNSCARYKHKINKC